VGAVWGPNFFKGKILRDVSQEAAAGCVGAGRVEVRVRGGCGPGIARVRVGGCVFSPEPANILSN